jgi:DNA-directed RNA polymerase subunit K/omega
VRTKRSRLARAATKRARDNQKGAKMSNGVKISPREHQLLDTASREVNELQNLTNAKRDKLLSLLEMVKDRYGLPPAAEKFNISNDHIMTFEEPPAIPQLVANPDPEELPIPEGKSAAAETDQVTQEEPTV